LLIVTLGLFGLAGVLGVLALGKIKRGTPPVPEQAIREAKLTTEALKR
jgi:multisubunit Na+/H+ antiporter MnhC subunit